MGKRNFLAEVRHHAAEIQRLYNHGHETGYNQARYHLNEIGELMRSASQLTYPKNDVPLIHSIYKEMQELADKWKGEINGG